MTYLLDTHTLLWAIVSPEKLSETTRLRLEDSDNTIWVSAVSFWEISLKSSLGKLHIDGLTPDDLPSLCSKLRFDVLALEPDICAGYHRIGAFHHKDPFDRMLVWQAKQMNVPIISADATIKQYESIGIKVLW